jgi:dethiobiotin synthetase
MSCYCVTGTDTGVGKTVASLLLMRVLFQAGVSPRYWKPLQTGCTTAYAADSDARFIHTHCPEFFGRDAAEDIGMLFPAPKAPLFAARDVGCRVNMEALCAAAPLYSAQFPLVMEGAGGVLVPVTETQCMADLMVLMGAIPIVIARAGLGTINHTLLTVEALHGRGLVPVGIILMESPHLPTVPDMLAENMEAIRRASGVPVYGVVSVLPDFSNLSGDALVPFQKLLTASMCTEGTKGRSV